MTSEGYSYIPDDSLADKIEKRKAKFDLIALKGRIYKETGIQCIKIFNRLQLPYSRPLPLWVKPNREKEGYYILAEDMFWTGEPGGYRPDELIEKIKDVLLRRSETEEESKQKFIDELEGL